MRTNLKLLRVRFNFTQEEMAKRLGVNKSTYSFIERGIRQGSVKFWLKFKMEFAIPDSEMWMYQKPDEESEFSA